MPILLSNNLDPYHNLAVESGLLDGLGPALPVLFFWQSDRAVVIGKNQNPWRECNLAYMAANQIPLCRRESGGGAVYHDRGNLNFCMVVDRNTYGEEHQYRILIKALAALDVSVRREGQSSLFSGERKVSGNAYCFRRDRAMHHGTLLVDTDLEPLQESLRPPHLDIETHAIPSVPARVANLKALHPEISLLGVQAALISRWEEAGPDHAGRIDSDCFPAVELEKRRKRLASEAWCYGHTPKFSFRVTLPSGTSLALEIRKGRVEALSLSDGQLPDAELAWAREQILGRSFGQPILVNAAPSGECAAVVDALNGVLG